MATEEMVLIPLTCERCGKGVEIGVERSRGFSHMNFFRIDCPHCDHVHHPLLPADVVDVFKVGEAFNDL
jgi:hypothetical protein